MNGERSQSSSSRKDHARRNDGADNIQVEIVNGGVTPEQRVAYKRFMDYLKAKVIEDYCRTRQEEGHRP